MHAYASVSDLKNFIRDNGAATTGGLGTTNDELLRLMLEAASRRVDEFTNRSRSGFGPRTGVNRYNGPGKAVLRLDDDLLAITSVTALEDIGGDAETIVVDTDFYAEPYSGPPWQELRLHEEASPSYWYDTTRGIAVTGTWGYSNETESYTTLAAAIESTTAEAATLTAAAEIGHTYLIDSEQVYVKAEADTTPVIKRGQNGTTAATHLNGATVYVYLYPREVVDATLRIALRRWRSRDAGLTGEYGGGEVPATQNQESENAILHATVGHLKRFTFQYV